MTTTPDLEYITDGIWTRFIPNTHEGEKAWLVMAGNDSIAAVMTIHLPSVLRQIRNAGYSVKKAKPSTQSIDDILKELETL